MDCVFCKIARGEIPCKSLYKDDKILIFKDLNPQAPFHLLAIPIKHISSLYELTTQDKDIMGHLMVKIPEVIKKLGIEEDGIRIVNNCGPKAGQSVFHIHFHILAGRSFSWPPG